MFLLFRLGCLISQILFLFSFASSPSFMLFVPTIITTMSAFFIRVLSACIFSFMSSVRYFFVMFTLLFAFRCGVILFPFESVNICIVCWSGICSFMIYITNVIDYDYIACESNDYDYNYLRWCTRLQSITITDYELTHPYVILYLCIWCWGVHCEDPSPHYVLYHHEC